MSNKNIVDSYEAWLNNTNDAVISKKLHYFKYLYDKYTELNPYNQEYCKNILSINLNTFLDNSNDLNICLDKAISELQCDLFSYFEMEFKK